MVKYQHQHHIWKQYTLEWEQLTLLGFDFSFAFFAAERIADFRLELCNIKIRDLVHDDDDDYCDDDNDGGGDGGGGGGGGDDAGGGDVSTLKSHT